MAQLNDSPSEPTSPENWRFRWRTALLILACCYPTIFTWLYFVSLEQAAESIQKIVYLIGKLGQFVLLPALCLWLVNDARWGWPMWSRRTLLWGFGTGLLIATSIILPTMVWLIPGGYFAGPAEIMRAKLAGFGLNSPAKYAALALFYTVLHSGAEEFYWRWLIDRGLQQTWGYWSSLLLSSLGFAAHHVVIVATYLGWANPWSYLAATAVGIGGAIWASFDRQHQTIAAAWISHALVDAALFLIGWQLVA